MKEPDPHAFWKKYELLSSTKTFKAIDVKPKTCRFCKRTELEATFGMDAHLISELLGANTVISNDECDDCNKIFSGYESHLSKFFLPYLTMTGTTGKRGVPAFYSRTIDRNENTRTIIKSEENKRQVYLSDLPDYEIDKENKRMILTFRKPPLTPFLVYKALAKIGLALLPEKELSHFNEVFKWLIADNEQVSVFVSCLINVLTSLVSR